MQYTKPKVLTTVNANDAIQSGTDDAIKSNPTVMDSAPHPRLSTTAAYEADE
jgi:hypothetical protein